jgi:hypothetical protein
MTDEEADRVWRKSNDVLFGTHAPTTLELQQQIDNLNKLLQRRQQQNDKQAAREMTAGRHPRAQAMQSRVFRQGIESDTADKNTNQGSSQSSSRNEVFSRKQAVQVEDETTFLKTRKSVVQSKSSDKSSFTDKRTDTDKTKTISGQIKSTSCTLPSD